MRPFRRFIASDIGQGIVAALIVFYIRFVYRTNRWQRVGFDIGYRLQDENRHGIICFWHNRLLMMPYAKAGKRSYHLLSSDHRDGLLMARAVRRFGIHVFFGSSSRRPTQALMKTAEICAAGGVVCITPDGPRGPRMRAAPGPVLAAGLAAKQLAKGQPTGATPATAVLVPVSYATSRRRMLSTWDRFLLPLPFGRGAFVVGPEIEVAAGLDAEAREALRLRLEEALNAVTAEADRLTGHPPVEPAPAR